MANHNSKRPALSGKPSKPYGDFPLTAHGNGQWCKKIKGTLWYFGPWSDPEGALRTYLAERDQIHAGLDPRKHIEGTSLIDLCNRFLTERKQALDRRELISQEHFDGLHKDCERLLEILGKNSKVEGLSPSDFSRLKSRLAEGVSLKTLEGRMARIRAVFQFGLDTELYESVRWSNKFRKPGKPQLERERNLKREEHGEYAFEANQVKQLLDAARNPLKAMILLGVQAGFQNTDCVELTMNAVHLEDSEIRMVRRKRGGMRIIPMWSETREALIEVTKNQVIANDSKESEFVFLTKYGNRWNRDSISTECRKILQELGIYRPGLSFSSLRKTFRTVADEVGDAPAVFHIMGHDMMDISDKYREKISRDRLQRVVEHVHQWLFNPPSRQPSTRRGHRPPHLRVVG